MQRLGQVLVAAVTVTGTCIGGAAAIGSVTGASPLAVMSAAPSATRAAFTAIRADFVKANSGSLVGVGNGAAPATHGTTGASGAAGHSANAVSVAAKSGATHAKSGASGSTTATGSKKAKAKAHAKSGASGAKGGGGREHEDGERDD